MFGQLSCGAYALKDYFYYYRQKVFTPRKDINSFQQIIDEAKFWITFIPQKTSSLTEVTPCITKFGDNHFVLVTSVTRGLVYYIDNGLPRQLPLDDFNSYYKGFVLSEKEDVSAVILTENDCLKIVGYKKGTDILKIAAPIAIGLLTGGSGFALAPWFGSTATGALLGGTTSAALTGGKPKQWLPSAGLGALGAGGAASAATKFVTGFAQPGTTAATSMGQVSVKPTLWQQLVGGTKGLMGTGGVGNLSGKVAGTSVNPLTQVATAMGKPVLLGQTAQGTGGFIYTPGADGIIYTGGGGGGSGYLGIGGSGGKGIVIIRYLI